MPRLLDSSLPRLTLQIPLLRLTQEITNADLYLDEVFQRKVMRQMEAERRERQEQEEEDDDDDAPNASIIAGPSRNIKKERGQSRRVEDVDESD